MSDPIVIIQDATPPPIVVVRDPLTPKRVVSIAQQGPAGPQGPQGPAGQASTSTVTLGATFATNQPYRVVGGVAVVITSLDPDPPFVDGILLDSGSSGDVRPAAVLGQDTYLTPLALPPGVLYFLGQDGKLTSTVPTSLAGDLWLVILARQVDSLHFLFSPTQPTAL